MYHYFVSVSKNIHEMFHQALLIFKRIPSCWIAFRLTYTCKFTLIYFQTLHQTRIALQLAKKKDNYYDEKMNLFSKSDTVNKILCRLCFTWPLVEGLKELTNSQMITKVQICAKCVKFWIEWHSSVTCTTRRQQANQNHQP